MTGRGTRVPGPWSAALSGDALVAQELPDRIGRLRAIVEPVPRALLVDHDLRGLGLRVVAADRLDHTAVARRALVGDDDAPDRILLAPHAGEADSYGHKRRKSLAAHPAHQLLHVRHLAAG